MVYDAFHVSPKSQDTLGEFGQGFLDYSYLTRLVSKYKVLSK